MEKQKLHLVCNAHLDPIYMWQLPEGITETLSTFRTAARFCEEFDGLVFNHNEALLYEYVREYEPALFKRIQKLVKEGKWHIMGGWYLQPDCNLPSGESMVRQIYAGKMYFKKYFGVEPETAINFDSFGHSRGLVQLLKKSGYHSYLFCRPVPGEFPQLKEDDFRWIGFDGSEVLAHRSSEHYSTNIGQAYDAIREWMADKDASRPQLYLWGIGDHGGGPSRLDLQKIEKLKAECADFDICHSTPEAYFEELRDSGKADRLQKVEDSLNPVSQGTYTTLLRVKQGHRKLENELFKAEKMLAHAGAAGLLVYPQEELSEGMRDLMLAEFHDVLPGSIIRNSEHDVVRLIDHGLEIAGRLQLRAFTALLAGQKPMRKGEIPIFAYNPHPYPVRGVFECEYGLPYDPLATEEELAAFHRERAKTDHISIPTVYMNGKKLPSQLDDTYAHKPFEWRKHSVFYAELPASSMTRLDCVFERKRRCDLPVIEQPQDELVVDRNPHLTVRINMHTGLLSSYCVDGVEYLSGEAFCPLVVEDRRDAYGWGALKFDEVLGRFTQMTKEEVKDCIGFEDTEAEPVRIVDDGEVRTVVQALFKYKHSQLCLRYMIPHEGTRLEMEAVVYWNEKGKMLKLSIPTVLRQGTYCGQQAYGVQELQQEHKEVFSHKWAGLFDRTQNRALTWGCDGGYGSDCADGEIRMTVLRSPLFLSGDHSPKKPYDPNRFSCRSDLGERCVRFWVQAGPADERRDHVDREALAWNEAPYLLAVNPSGCGEVPASLLCAEPSSVQVTAVKQAEDGFGGYVIRLYESAGQPVEASLSSPLAKAAVTVPLHPFEVKTVRLLPEKGVWQVQDELTV